MIFFYILIMAFCLYLADVFYNWEYKNEIEIPEERLEILYD